MTRRQARIRLDGARIDAALLGDAAGDGVELHRLQERDQVLVVRLVHGEVVCDDVERHVLVERHQFLRQPRLLGERGQVLAALGLLDLGCVREQVLKIAVLAKQFRRSLRADARHARHVVGGIADQRLRLDHLLWADAEFFDDLLGTDAAVLHGVVHDDAVADELHQILVGRDNCRRRPGLAGEPRVGGDQVVGFEADLLQVRQLEGTHRVADQRELRPQDPPAFPAGAPCIRDTFHFGRSFPTCRTRRRDGSACPPASSRPRASTACCRSRARR